MELFLGAFMNDWEQRRAALLHEQSAGRRRAAAEEELERRRKALGEGGGGGGSGRAARGGSVFRGGVSDAVRGRAVGGQLSVERPMAARLRSVAGGSQPAVVKMASYGGGSRVGAMLSYVSRSGDLKVETESGRQISGREDIARVRDDWEHLFQNRAESRDIGGFHVEIREKLDGSEEEIHDRVRQILNAGFGGRRFAYTVTQGRVGSLVVDGVLVLRSPGGERLTGDQKAAEIVQGRYDANGLNSFGPAEFSFRGYGNGVEYGTSRVRALVEKTSDVYDERGRSIADEQVAGDLVQKEWRHELHSRKGRDVMHLIMSARAGTDPIAFEAAARDFLAQQFAGFRYVFAMHDPELDPKEQSEGGKRPHIHVHAIIVMNSDAGDRIETSPAVFREWRLLLAEKARQHGIQMEMTDRREFASAPAYGRNQVRPVNHEGRTEHVGTSGPAQLRYDDKRGEHETLASSERSRSYAKLVREVWSEIAESEPDETLKVYAKTLQNRVEEAMSAWNLSTVDREGDRNLLSPYRSNMVLLEDLVSEGQDVREQTRAEFEVYEKAVESALDKLERSVEEEDREDFDMVAGLARDILKQRRELVGLYEQREEAKISQAQAASAQSDASTGKDNRRYAQSTADNVIALTSQAAIARPVETQGLVQSDQAKKAEASTEAGTDQKAKAAQAQSVQAVEEDRSFPAEIMKRYYVQGDRDGTQRVFADFKATRELFQDAGQHLRTKADELHTIRLMVETAAHRGWSDVTVGGTEDFRREAWIEAHARGIAVNGYKPTELDWQEVSRREQTWLRNEIRPTQERAAEAGPGGRARANEGPPAAHEAKQHRDERQAHGGEQHAREDAPAQKGRSSSRPAPVNYREGVEGTLVEAGDRPYKDNDKNENSPYVVLETGSGRRTVWGVGLPDALEDADAKVGDKIRLREAGWETVRKTVIEEIDGHPTRVEKDVERRAWKASVVEQARRVDDRAPDAQVEPERARSNERSSEPTRETRQTDPARQHVPRLDQLEREKMEERERDRDDRER